MNYLAHAYLSFGDPELLLGNMISDFVKGKKKFDYPPKIQQGIMLHRAIDTFTDDHEITKAAKEIFRPHYRLYSGAFVDVVYDHFLATDSNHFTDESLLQFTEATYQNLSAFSSSFPERFAKMFPHMRQQNWLYHYNSKRSIQKSLQGVVYRSAYLTESETAYHLFELHFEELKHCYHSFFPLLAEMCLHFIEEINTRPDNA